MCQQYATVIAKLKDWKGELGGPVEEQQKQTSTEAVLLTSQPFNDDAQYQRDDDAAIVSFVANKCWKNATVLQRHNSCRETQQKQVH